MTSKLRRKLQTTIQRITVDPRNFCGRPRVCRATVLFSAILVAGFAGADSRFVRPVAYQQSLSETGNVPVVRIESVSEKTCVTPVSYAAPQNQAPAKAPTQSASASTSGKPLKWVSVNSPEAREIGRSSSAESNSVTKNSSGGTVKQVAAERAVSEAPMVTPIPAMMPRYSRVRLTAGEEKADSATAPESGINALDLNSLDLGSDSGLENSDSKDGGLSEPLAMPAENPENTLVPEDTTSDMQIPGAIGKEEESTLNQGGLNQNEVMPENGPAAPETDSVGNELRNQLPKVAAPELPPEVDLKKDSLTESITTRQVDVEDYDMPCESSEPMHRITEITNDIDLKDHKIVPKSCPLAPVGEAFPAREFAGTNVTWTASNLCHNPLYFEQPALERYGHTIGPLQPVLSGAQFLATIPAMPLLMAIDPPNECQYALGYYRPGSCAPYKWSPIPYSTRGAIVEGGVATALVFLIP